MAPSKKSGMPHKKKILIISYYWPPAGGISVLRSLKIAKYLRAFGWEPIVYAPSNAHYPYNDDGGFIDIPENLEIIKQPIIEPFQIFKWLTGRKKTDPLNAITQISDSKSGWLDQLGIYIRGNFFIPDARAFWIKPSVKYLTSYLKNHPVDALFSDGPPHTNTYIASQLKKTLGIPWLMDFQDPWTQADYYKMMPIGKRASRRHIQMEQECFHNADKISIASPSWKTDLENIGAKNVDVLYYGYDEDDFANSKKKESKKYFDIVHIGLLGHDRSPGDLVEILESLSSNKSIRLILAGQVDQSVLESLVRKSSQIEVQELGTISRKKALQLAIDANLLLLPLNKSENSKGRLPGKIYEYLRTFNPILALGPTDSDAHTILKQCRAGVCYEYNDNAAIKSYIQNILSSDSSNFKSDKTEILKYSNRNQTQNLSKWLDQLI